MNFFAKAILVAATALTLTATAKPQPPSYVMTTAIAGTFKEGQIIGQN